MAKLKKQWNKRTLRILSRHPSHDVLRKDNKPIFCDHQAVIRFGSQTVSKIPIQINSIESIKNSSNKFKMKTLFKQHNVITSDWLVGNVEVTEDGLKQNENLLEYPIVIKKFFGSRGSGNFLIQNHEEMVAFKAKKNFNFNNVLYEKYYNYTREYRLHVTQNKCFYTCRKMLKHDAEERWYKNDNNCVWILEDNPNFNKPITWNDIVIQCCLAVKAVGLDIGACDVLVNKKGEFRILETNSAAGLGTIGEQKYREILPVLVAKKAALKNK